MCSSGSDRVHTCNISFNRCPVHNISVSEVCSSVMLSQIGEEKCGSTLVDLVLYSECEDVTARPVNNYSAVLTRMKRKCCSSVKSLDDSPQKLLRTLQEKFKSSKRFHKVLVLRDGFNDFHSRFPELCESSKERRENKGKVESHIRTSVSHPCLSSSSDGPTQILPFLYLGSQQDAMDSGVLSRYGIKYVINLSVNCPQPDALKQEGHFMRIPVSDTYQEKLLPHFEDAFKFLDEVCERGSVALVHCLAGISRSPTLAIAYMMRRNNWTSEQAYRYVKERRPSISPNLNFMGQLLEYEARLREKHGVDLTRESSDSNTASSLSYTLSSVSSSDSPDGALLVKECCSDNTSNLGKSISCDALSQRASFRPQSFWDSDCSEPSSMTNENGKRAMKSASPHLLDRPRVLDGLKSRKALNIPQKVDEDLPSPSTELQKLSFMHSPDTMNSASNPFFCTDTTGQTSLSVDVVGASSSREEHYSAENLTFVSRSHPSIPLTLPSSNVSGNDNHRTTTSHKFLTRLSHCLRKGACPMDHSSKIVTSSTATAAVVKRKPMVTTSSVISSCSTLASQINKTVYSPSAPSAVIRSHSVSALDKTLKRGANPAVSHASFVLSNQQRMMEHQKQHLRQEHSHFITPSAVAASSASISGSIAESSTSFREADRDSIGSSSSLEILVQ